MDSNVPMDILINGFLAQRLKNGETKTIKLTNDNQPIELRVHLMMNKLPPMIVTPEEMENNIFQIENVVSNTAFIIGIALAIISTILVLRTNQLIYMLIVAPPALYHLYFKWYRKDRYLSVRKIAKS